MTRRNSPPAWLIFLVSLALVLGVFYWYLGVREYFRTGGLGIVEATAQAEVRAATQSVVRLTQAIPTWTLIPSFTPLPPCDVWVVTVDSAIVRVSPNVNSAMVMVFNGGEEVCVIQRIGGTDWLQVDTNTDTRRIEEGYMREDLIRPRNPTPTATLTVTPLPTITPLPTATASNTPAFVAPSVTPAATGLATVTPVPPTATASNTPAPLLGA